jgi:hypothetical protein
MTSPKITEQHGSRIIAALEHAWAAIQDQHPDVPDVVIVTGAGSNQKGTPEGYQLRGHHWPERWVLDGQDAVRAPELFIAGEARHAQRLFEVIVGILPLTCANALAGVGYGRSPPTRLPRICHASASEGRPVLSREGHIAGRDEGGRRGGTPAI